MGLCSYFTILFVFIKSSLARVLKALTRKFKLLEDVSLYSIAKKCPRNFTGADMYALCADAWFHAAKRKVSQHCKFCQNKLYMGFFFSDWFFSLQKSNYLTCKEDLSCILSLLPYLILEKFIQILPEQFIVCAMHWAAAWSVFFFFSS